jgi:5-formyltetrahydrofolate cyclo-ligase
MDETPFNPEALKQSLRRQTLALRRHQLAKDKLSQIICEKVAGLEEYRRAKVVMGYVGVRSEVRTRSFLARTLESGKVLVVPYCVGRELELFRLESMDELAQGYFGLLEPAAELRGREDKQIEVAQIDLVLVPGIAFDRQGGRIGHGKGYYDRLLYNVRPDTCLVGAAFECQMVAAVPMQPHDVFMDLVITEKAVEQGRGRSR